jgi:hypothetical protein
MLFIEKTITTTSNSNSNAMTQVTYLPSSREPSTDLIFVALSSKRPLRKIAAKKGSKMHLKAAA